MIDSGKPLGIIRKIMLTGVIMLFLSVWLHAWVYRQAPEQENYKFLNIYAGGERKGFTWKPLEEEKQLYRKSGYSINFMEGTFVQQMRTWMPYPAIFEVMILRIYGMLLLSPAVLFLCLLGGVEGWIRYHEKQAVFGNISSTRFKISLICTAFIICFSWLFICLPFGTDIPHMGSLPLVIDTSFGSIWLTAPHLWIVILSPAFFFIAHQVMSNLSRNI